MLSEKIETIILDVDGTLSKEVSWLKITESLGASIEKHSIVFDKFKKGLLKYPEAKAKLIKLWQATGNANKEFMERQFRSWALKEDAKETVEYLKKTYRVCLISGSMDLYVQVVAEKLGVTDWYANTELIWNKKGNLVDFNYHLDQAQKKLEQLQDYITKNKLDLNKCAVVGNGDSDTILFKKLKYSVEVNETPSPELKGLAHKTITNLKELREVF